MSIKEPFALARSPFEHQRLLLVVMAGLVVNVATALLIAEQQWIYLGMAIGTLGVASLLLLRPATCLMLVFAFLPFQPLLNDVFARATSLVAVGKDLLMVVLVLSLLWNHMLLRRSWYINAPMYWFLLFALVGTLSAATAPDLLRGVLGLRFLALYPALIVLAANALETATDVRRMLRLIAVVGAITVVYGILQYLFQFDVPYRTSGGDVRLRMGRFDELAMVSTFASRPMFGGWLIPLFLLFLTVKGQAWGRVWSRLRWLALGAIASCALLTYSRSTWLALIVSTLVTLWLKNKLKGTLVASALGLCLVLFYATQSYFAPASLSEAATSGESFRERLSYWPMVFRHVVAHPLGLGLGTVGGPHLFEAGAQADAYGNLQYDPFELFDPQAGLGPDNRLMVTDNTFLKLLVQGGVPLLIPFLGLLISVVHLVSTMLRQAREPWMRDLVIWAAGSMAALLTIFMFVDFMETGPAIAFYWLVIGILCCLRKLSQESHAGVSQSGNQAVTD